MALVFAKARPALSSAKAPGDGPGGDGLHRPADPGLRRAPGGPAAGESASLLGVAEVHRLAAGLELRPTKSRGQNFVTDPNTVRRIVRVARLKAQDVVLEVGPGLGSLTLGLLPVASHVIAVELDELLADALPTTVAAHQPQHLTRLDVVVADAMKVRSLPGPPPSALVSNLPYNVAVPVLLNLLEAFPSLQRALVMVQLEVAERLAAAPGSRTYGVPSVKARWYGDVEMAGQVGRNVFWPVPNVDSGLVALNRRQPPTAAGREETFAVIDAAFSQRRKTLRGALAALAGSPDRAERALRAAEIDPAARGETLDVADFARVARALAAR